MICSAMFRSLAIAVCLGSIVGAPRLASAQPLPNPPQDIAELGRFGCEDFLAMRPKDLAPSSERKSDGDIFRKYEVGEIVLITTAAQREVIDALFIPAAELVSLNIIDRSMLDISDFARRFGPPTRVDGGTLAYSTGKYERAIVLIHSLKDSIIKIEWSCH